MFWLSLGFYAIVIGLVVWHLRKKKKNESKNAEYNTYASNTATQVSSNLPSFKDVENCLLQQTTTYDRGTPFVFATNEQNELFLVYFYHNTFYIVKVICENNKFKVVYDYRQKHMLLSGFKYRKNKEQIRARLDFSNMSVEFCVSPDLNYSGCGCNFTCDQSDLYDALAANLETYKQNINNCAKDMKKDDGYFELKKAMQNVTERDRMRINQLIEIGHEIDAIKMLQECTKLGLAECKKIADNPKKYLQ